MQVTKKIGLINSAIFAALVVFALAFPATGMAQEISVSGFTEPYKDSTLGLPVTGQVVKILVKEGDKVKQWQALLELNQQSETLEMKRRQLLAESKTEITAVSKQLQTLKSHLAATKELYESTGSIPREDVENQELEYALAEVELLRLQDAEKREMIELDIAKKQLHKRTLRAPFAGVIAEIKTGVGENCELDTELVQLVNTSRGYFVANVELGISQRLKLGQEVELQFQTGLEPISKKASIAFISPVVDPASGLRKIKAKFSNKDGKLIPGVSGIMVVKSEE